MSEIVAYRYKWRDALTWVHSTTEPARHPNLIVEPLCKVSALDEEREVIANEARRYAAFYPEASDGRNTFLMFADFVERRMKGEPLRADGASTPIRHEAVGWLHENPKFGKEITFQSDIAGLEEHRGWVKTPLYANPQTEVCETCSGTGNESRNQICRDCDDEIGGAS